MDGESDNSQALCDATGPPSSGRAMGPPSSGGGKRRDRDRDTRDAHIACVQARIPYLTKVHASDGQLSLLCESDSKALCSDTQWMWHYVCGVLAEDYSVFDAVLERTVEDAKATIWHMRGTCPRHSRKHAQNHWCLINTVGFPYTTLFLCHHDNSRAIMTKLPF